MDKFNNMDLLDKNSLTYDECNKNELLKSVDCYIYDENSIVIFYISDLHLDEKINNKNIKKELIDVVEKLKLSLHFCNNCKVFIVGDVSHNFNLFKMFFKIYSKNIEIDTFFILGNHELWDDYFNQTCNSFEEICEQYRKFFNKLKGSVTLLQNQIYFPNGKQHIYSIENIDLLSDNELRKLFLKNGYAILGGLGFAGFENKYNNDYGLYKSNLINRKIEIDNSNLFARLHNRIKNIAGDKLVYVVTHMPLDNWLNTEMCKNWKYISGHTHKASYKPNIYDDNQVGYENKNYAFKYISDNCNYDIFKDYKEGIFDINRQQYKRFYTGLVNRYMEFNRPFYKLYMLKRENVYLFLIQLRKGDKLKVLCGGEPRNVGNHEINYFYNNMLNYSNSIKLFLNEYEQYQKTISKNIKDLGGDGKIHGCIIDIDFYNHLYVNPIDNKITPYYATDTVNKIVYTNVISLLYYRNRGLYKNMVKLLEHNKNDYSMVIGDLTVSDKTILYKQTDIYKMSRFFSGLQYTTNFNIIRLWQEDLIEYISVDNGKCLIGKMLEEFKIK